MHPEALRPKRRTSAEVQQLVLDAAIESFAREGYGGAATKRIAANAGVNETVIFRYFRSKAGLYEAAVLESARSLVAALHRTSTADPDACGVRNRVEDWVLQLDGIASQHHALLVALLNPGPRTSTDDLERRLHSVREDLFGELDRGARAAVGGAPHDFGRSIAVRAILTMLMASRPDAHSLPIGTTQKAARSRRNDEILRIASSTLIAAALPGRAQRESRNFL